MLRLWAKWNAKKWEIKIKISKFSSEFGEGVYFSNCLFASRHNVFFREIVLGLLARKRKQPVHPLWLKLKLPTIKKCRWLRKVRWQNLLTLIGSLGPIQSKWMSTKLLPLHWWTKCWQAITALYLLMDRQEQAKRSPWRVKGMTNCHLHGKT